MASGKRTKDEVRDPGEAVQHVRLLGMECPVKVQANKETCLGSLAAGLGYLTSLCFGFLIYKMG